MRLSNAWLRRERFLIVLALLMVSPVRAEGVSKSFTLPAFTQQDADAWINSKPLTREDIRGRVTLIEVWTYGCGNCRRSLPWVASLYERYAGKGLEIIGIHTPEFAWEKPRTAVLAAVKLHGIEYPVMMDNDMRYWRALGNRYWPAFYLVDKQGRVVGYYVGETHIDSRQARAIENQLNTLITPAAYEE